MSELDLIRQLLPGALVTAEIAALAIPVTVAIGVAAGLARISNWSWLRAVAYVYVQIFRGTSLLVQVFYFFFVLPLMGITLPPLPVGVLAVALNAGAYFSEVVRGAIINVDRGQWEAAFALNMPRRLALRRIVLPQAVALMLPPFANQAIDILKGSALLSLITITELTQQGRIIFEGTNAGAPAIYLTILLMYFVMAQPLSFAVRYFERRQPQRQRGHA